MHDKPRKPFLVTVRFKSDAICPCPKAHSEIPVVRENWQKIAGTSVTLVSPTQHPPDGCGSDVYWLVIKTDKLRELQQRNRGYIPKGDICACRHVLDIGD